MSMQQEAQKAAAAAERRLSARAAAAEADASAAHADVWKLRKEQAALRKQLTAAREQVGPADLKNMNCWVVKSPDGTLAWYTKTRGSCGRSRWQLQEVHAKATAHGYGVFSTLQRDPPIKAHE